RNLLGPISAARYPVIVISVGGLLKLRVAMNNARLNGRRHAPRWLELLEPRIVLSTSTPLSTTSWTPIGPFAQNGSQIPGGGASSGVVMGIAADPSSNTIYVNTGGGGVWKSSNAGASWKIGRASCRERVERW